MFRLLSALFVVSAMGCAASLEDDAPLASTQAELTAEQCHHFQVDGKAQICHATGAKKHPYKILNVSAAGCVDGHAGHVGDYVAVNDPTCQGGGCLPSGAPCDDSLPCCDGLTCESGSCVATNVIGDIQFGGTGCPQFSALFARSSDGQSVTFFFGGFHARIGPGISAAEARKSCQINIDFTTRPGFTWSFEQENQGTMTLDAGVQATLDETYFFANRSQAAPTDSFFGPRNSDYVRHTGIAASTFGSVDCDGGSHALNIISTIGLSKTSDQQKGNISTFDITGRMSLIPCQ